MEIKVVRQILEWNADCDKELKKLLNEKKVLMLNIMGSPGGGKTTFITRIIENLRTKYKIGVIEADIAGKIDAEKMADMGIPVVQLNTDGACHTEAESIKNILPFFNLDDIDILIVENIGNLVCPAEFDIGEDLKIALLSIPEGDDKVEKYPLMFSRADAIVLSKYDMKDYFQFDDNRVINNVKNNNSNAVIFKINSSKGEGINTFVNWIQNYIKK
ncbi:MAG: hydrogenase nickel incorporation protein HypB [Bacillota bacterium]|nr:hydrogenase nickel incorporation protein HypB [Bacillota bacterium]